MHFYPDQQGIFIPQEMRIMDVSHRAFVLVARTDE